jgi:hypothetical protein
MLLSKFNSDTPEPDNPKTLPLLSLAAGVSFGRFIGMKCVLICMVLMMIAAPSFAATPETFPPYVGPDNSYPGDNFIYYEPVPNWNIDEIDLKPTPVKQSVCEKHPVACRRWHKFKSFCKETLVPTQWVGAALGIGLTVGQFLLYIL